MAGRGICPMDTTTITDVCDSPTSTLLPHHWKKLHEGSGLTLETIQAAGIYSETSVVKIKALLDCKTFPSKCLPAIVFPFTDAEGRNGYCRIKPDHPRTSGGKPVKYESPRGKPNEIYLPPGVAAVLADPTRELLGTEGEKKALAATQAGFPCIGLVGVFGWKPGKKETLLPALERVAWQGRKVYIVFDSDIADNPNVQDAESRLAAHLANRGATVRVVRLPRGEPGADGKPTKQGIDDYLTIQPDPAKAMRALLDAAEEPTPVDGGELQSDASAALDSATEAKAILDRTVRDGIPRLRFWRGTWLYCRHGAYRERQLAEVRAQVVTHLITRYRRLASHHTSDVIDVLKALAYLDYATEPPTWIGDSAIGLPDPRNMLVARNGIIDLAALTEGRPDYMRPATPQLFTTSALDYDFRLDAPRPAVWLQFLSDLWPDDADSISTLQEWAGYLLTSNTAQHKILLTIGPPRSGKGCIGRVLRGLIGVENACGPTLASLATNFGLWPLIGKSLAILSDARLGGRTDSQIVVERLLSISGEDCLTADRKNLEPVTVKLPTRLMILSNELPRLGDSSGALASRMIVLRLTQSFYGHEDHSLTERLLGELPSILLWAIVGWQRLRERGHFVQPQAAAEMVGDLKDLGSPIAAFLRERCGIGPEYEVARPDLYEAYAEWCKEKGRQHVPDDIVFGRDLRSVLPGLTMRQPRVDGERQRFHVGVGLKSLF